MLVLETPNTATSRESRLASSPKEACDTIKASRAEFWKLMQHEDEDYTDPDFAGETDRPSTKVEHPVPTRLGSGLRCHYLIKRTPIRFQQPEPNLVHNYSGHSKERFFAEASSEDHLKHRRSRAIRLEDEDEDHPIDEDIPQLHRHLEGDEIDQTRPDGNTASPQPVSLDCDQPSGQYETDRSESPFGPYYNRPLAGNEFYDRRPPPGFNLLHCVKQSVAAYNKSFGISQSTTRASYPLKPGPASSSSATLPSVDSSPLKSAPTHRLAANHQSQTTTSKSTSRTTKTDERTRRSSERARAGIAYPKGRVASEIHTGDARDISTRRTLNTNGIGSHRHFKPTTKKPRRRR